MDNLYLATRGEVEHMFENDGGFINIFEEIGGNALLIASEMWKARSLAESVREGGMRRGKLQSSF